MLLQREQVVANGMPWCSENIEVYLSYRDHLILGEFMQVYVVPQGEPSPSYIFASYDLLVHPIELHISYPFEEVWNPFLRRNFPLSEIKFLDSKTKEEIKWWEEWKTYFKKQEEKNSNVVDWNKYLGIKK